jgi:hypothetical protein
LFFSTSKQTYLLATASSFLSAAAAEFSFFRSIQIDRSWKVIRLACVFRVANWRLDDNRSSSSNEKCVIDGARQTRLQT